MKNNMNKNNNLINAINNNLNMNVKNVPKELDILSVIFIIVLVVLLSSKLTIPEEAKLSFLLALILLISCYNIEIGIVVVIIAIIYVLVQNSMKKKEDIN